LRRDMTKAERTIWYGLRAHRLEGAGFRRQTPIGPYIVDFVSHAAKLIIEIDGGQHFDDAVEARDKRRDAFLVSKGFRVLRLNNHDVMTNRIGVLETIAAAVREARAPSLPSPASGGGGARGTPRVQKHVGARGVP
jgi:very-short-patch-repair endonuclease